MEHRFVVRQQQLSAAYHGSSLLTRCLCGRCHPDFQYQRRHAHLLYREAIPATDEDGGIEFLFPKIKAQLTVAEEIVLLRGISFVR